MKALLPLALIGGAAVVMMSGKKKSGNGKKTGDYAEGEVVAEGYMQEGRPIPSQWRVIYDPYAKMGAEPGKPFLAGAKLPASGKYNVVGSFADADTACKAAKEAAKNL